MKKPICEIMNHEYLMTNGLGGYSFGTLDQVNCRKYHSLYTVSYNPPIERMHLISKIEEVFSEDGKLFPLTYENVTNDNITSENEKETESNLISYAHEGVIVQTFKIIDLGVDVVRTLGFAYGTNRLAVRYEIESPKKLNLALTPWFNFRDHHDAVTPEVQSYKATYEPREKILGVTAEGRSVYIKVAGNLAGATSNTTSNATSNTTSKSLSDLEPVFTPSIGLTPLCHYPVETQRGYPDKEAHVILGTFNYEIKEGKNVIDILVNITPEFESADSVFSVRKLRYEQLMKHADAVDPQLKRLVQAADDFIVYRKNTGKMSIIAGYPWFSDWGRDTMISIPGLTLSTGRSEEALQMIEGFIAKSYRGIIPNNFPDEGEDPMYNTSDGTLWLFNAVNAYYDFTGDIAAIKRLYPKLMEILNHHIQGTINDIYMDTDGLLSTGNEKTQLTWMDVKVNGWVVTPRHGKAVEINALWYNALAIMKKITTLLNIKNEAIEVDFDDLLPKVKKAFNASFWNKKDQNLYDLVIEGEPVDIPRPNMIFAVSLPFPVLEERYWKPVVSYVEKHFKVPFGLLTLRREDKNFNATYGGDLLSRDGAYHRGTAWGWLIGPYLEAHYKTFHDKAAIKTCLDDLLVHLDEGIHGSISEIFEGGAPHAQRGCSAQAWSVAEAIRIWKMIE